MDDEDEVDIVGEFDEELSTPASHNYQEEIGLNINELLPFLGHGNSWLLNTDQVWNLDASIDERNKAPLEKCLPDRVKSPLVFSSEIKSLSSSSHKKPWTEAEKELLQKGMKAYGHSWTKISKFIGTRTTLQVKNFARQYLKQVAEKNANIGEDKSGMLTANMELCDNAIPPLSDHIYQTGKPTVLQIERNCAKKHLPVESKFVSIKKHSDAALVHDLDSKNSQLRMLKSIVVPSKEIVKILKESASSDSEDIDIEDTCAQPQQLFSKNDTPVKLIEKDSIKPFCNESSATYTNSVNCTSNNGLSDLKTDDELLSCLPLSGKESALGKHEFHNIASPVMHMMESCVSEDLDDGDVLDRADDLNSVDQESRRIFDLAVPEEELVLEKGSITEEEKIVHQEFFEGRSQKTPERYLKIRNFILDSWEKSKPLYLNKTSVRPGLKNCGDVNCIGRIHTYLEQIGAINFGCEQTVYSRPLVLLSRSLPSIKKTNSGFNSSNYLSREMMRPRKRKIPVLTYNSEDGGYTIKHGEDGEIIDVTEGVNCPNSTQKRVKVGDDPFKLIICSEFSLNKPAPFTLMVHVGALMVMDVHAHLSTLEVIGLLGGHFDSERALVHIIKAEPCESLSTGLECEMDPVSQTLASEKLQQEGFSIVGWYHSHPMFAPNPSVRDLDTQAKFQEWFGQGGAPFLGVIISPHLSFSPASKMCYMIVGEEHVLPEGYRKPYKFIPQYFHCGSDAEELISSSIALVQKWQASGSEGKTSISVLNKMLRSIQHHLAQAEVDQTAILTILQEVGKILVTQLAEENANKLYSKQYIDSVSTLHANKAGSSFGLGPEL